MDRSALQHDGSGLVGPDLDVVRGKAGVDHQVDRIAVLGFGGVELVDEAGRVVLQHRSVGRAGGGAGVPSHDRVPAARGAQMQLQHRLVEVLADGDLLVPALGVRDAKGVGDLDRRAGGGAAGGAAVVLDASAQQSPDDATTGVVAAVVVVQDVEQNERMDHHSSRRMAAAVVAQEQGRAGETASRGGGRHG
jgi:hypothetical protein